MRKVLSAALIALAATIACNKLKSEERIYKVNTSSSVAEWKGSAPDHFHVGSFKIEGSLLTRSDGDIQAGTFVIPISSIDNFDLPAEVKPQLLNHLKSADFFNIALHPNAEFRIEKVETLDGSVKGAVAGANKLVTGNLSLVGQTHPITFPAKIAYKGDSLQVEATLKIDRTKWGMTKYSNADSGLYIIPDADIHVKMQAAKV
ncbi:YceI family protein [Segetibacter aerophilus]|uniref:Polyisoprenoid-binding protein n=1 Tax=Segetibacter aerophilus TaxID=670293 RepID=A0A512BEY4_9BACT|nr:YceI family protein [Segetibacter aerophilus]GEO10504.1 polyisoprenoid-binding protein [Segetibacter aerophilus]